ncbi:hypothetical protein QTQ03_07835 [Micromonospora sp. WMMA1363]|nr:hypothetical protein [Micromonospora sp. WMMA1363]MDM4719511.1 hypothetical protein [Micromonospora sp. WMMA1363]
MPPTYVADFAAKGRQGHRSSRSAGTDIDERGLRAPLSRLARLGH